MEIRELCRKLKPVLGSRAEAYYVAWMAEDAKGRRDLESALQLLAAQVLGSDVDRPEAHLSAPNKDIASGSFYIGDVVYGNRSIHPFGLREDELIQHAAIFGRSGAGKTNTLFQIVTQFLQHKVPFLIFDWKRNYRDALAVSDDHILVYTVGRPIVPLAFNPLIPPEGTEPAVWLKKVIEIIAHAYYLGEGVMYLLQEAIHAVYKKYGLYRGRVQRYPTFQDVYQWLQEHPVKGRQALWMDSAMRGIKSICFGHMGEVVNTSDQSNLGDLLSKNVILELDGLSNADKTLITESMLLWIHHYRMRQPEREQLHHAIVVEEAHHILRRQSGGGAEPITETILREIRELGEAILLVDQHPSMISVPALGNTYTTICMNLKHRSDVSAMSSAMLLDDEEKELLGELPIGTAIIKLQGRWTRPFLVQIPHQKIPKGAITDSTLIQLMEPHIDLVPNQAPEHVELPEVSDGDIRLLQDVLEFPYSGVVERYRRLGVSRRKGNDWKESCMAKEMLSPVDIPTRSGRVVLLEPTKLGRAVLRQQGRVVDWGSRYGSLEHEYWKHRIAETLRQEGYDVQVEAGEKDKTDILAKSGRHWTAIEIETGKSDWKGNIKKNVLKGVDLIIIATTNEEAFNQIESSIEAESVTKPTIALYMAWDIVDGKTLNKKDGIEALDQ